MTTVVQTTYRPQQAAALEGMIADLSSSEVGTKLCETAAGIGFGLAVSQGTGDGGCVLGGSKFIGVSVRDVTLALAPVDPLSDTPNTLDKYGLYTNVGYISRGHIWVKARANVAAGDAVYYNTTDGGFTNSASGEAANGSITFTQQPADGDTVTLNGTACTFKDTLTTGLQCKIGATLGDTIVNLAAALNASADSEVAKCTYKADPPSPGGSAQGSGADTLLVAFDTVGTGGNSYTIVTDVTGATASGATLSGGSASATQVTGASWRTSALGGQLAKISLSAQV